MSDSEISSSIDSTESEEVHDIKTIMAEYKELEAQREKLENEQKQVHKRIKKTKLRAVRIESKKLLEELNQNKQDILQHESDIKNLRENMKRIYIKDRDYNLSLLSKSKIKKVNKWIENFRNICNTHNIDNDRLYTRICIYDVENSKESPKHEFVTNIDYNKLKEGPPEDIEKLLKKMYITIELAPYTVITSFNNNSQSESDKMIAYVDSLNIKWGY